MYKTFLTLSWTYRSLKFSPTYIFNSIIAFNNKQKHDCTEQPNRFKSYYRFQCQGNFKIFEWREKCYRFMTIKPNFPPNYRIQVIFVYLLYASPWRLYRLQVIIANTRICSNIWIDVLTEYLTSTETVLKHKKRGKNISKRSWILIFLIKVTYSKTIPFLYLLNIVSSNFRKLLSLREIDQILAPIVWLWAVASPFFLLGRYSLPNYVKTKIKIVNCDCNIST